MFNFFIMVCDIVNNIAGNLFVFIHFFLIRIVAMLYQEEEFPFISNLLRIFIMMGVEFCQMFFLYTLI